jgi:hypothetical protein
MKRSEAYHLAQVAVINAPTITPENKVEILRVLYAQEDLELWTERAEAGNETV